MASQPQQVNVVIQGIDEFSEVAKKLQNSLEGFYRLGEGDAKEAIGRMQEFGKAVTTVAQALKNPSTGLVPALTGFTIAGGMASAAFLGLIHSISQFASHEANLARMAKTLGVAREQLVAMDVVGKATGVDLLGSLDKAAQKMRDFIRVQGGAREWFQTNFTKEDLARLEAAGKREDVAAFWKVMVEGSQKIAPLFQQMATTELFGQANPQEFFNAVQQLNPALLKRLEINEKTAKTLDELDKAVIKLKIDYATTIQHLATDAAPTVLNTLKEVLHLLHDPIDESWQRWFGTVASGTPGPGAGSTLSQVARQTPRGLGQGLLTQYSVMPGMGGPRVGAAADTALDDWMRRNSGAGLGQTQVPQATQDAIAEAVRRGTAQGAQDASKREPGIGGIISGGAAGVWEWMKKNLSPISAAGAATMPGGGAAGAAGAPIGTAAAGMAAANAAAAMTPELFQRDPGLSGQTTTYSAGVPSATPGAYGGGVGGATGGASGGPRRPGGPGGTRGADTGTASVIPELGKTIKEALESTGKAQGINPVAIASMITVEDPSWKPGVTGGASGRYMGLTQVGPDTLKEMGVTPQQYLSMTAEQQIQFYSRWLDHYHFKEKLAAAGIDFSKLDSAQQAAVLQAMQFHPNQRGGSATTPPDWMVQIGKGNWDGAVATTSKQAGFLGGTLGSYRDFFKRQQANTVQARQAAADGTSVPGVGTGAIGQVMPVTGRVTGLVGDPRSSHTHAGIDIAAEEGSAISATEGGRVVRAQTQTGYGLTLDVQRPDGTIDRYAHMSAFGVRVGDTVKTGQYIGAVGHTTGTRTVVGSHLHYEHRQRSDFGFQGIIDPAPELGINRKSLMTRLDPIPHDSAALARKTGTPEKKGSVDIEVKVGGNEDLKTKHVWDDPFFRDYHKDDKQQNVGAQ